MTGLNFLKNSGIYREYVVYTPEMYLVFFQERQLVILVPNKPHKRRCYTVLMLSNRNIQEYLSMLSVVEALTIQKLPRVQQLPVGSIGILTYIL